MSTRRGCRHMPNVVLDKGEVSFTSEGRLLEELGLRLVASPEVALVELIKNAYDADSADCDVRLDKKAATLVVSDHGHGMTIEDFKNKWMQIATGSKASEQRSPLFKRLLTGAKGIGRFAVRYLGDYLTLESTALDRSRDQLTTLKATFNWPELDKTADLSKTRIPYELLKSAEHATTGTTLTVGKLRGDVGFATSRELRTNVLRIVSPLRGLETGRFRRAAEHGKSDPGFTVTLPGDEATDEENLADLALRHYWARLTISLGDDELVFTISFPGRKKPRVLKVSTETAIQKGFFADIRFFPRRKGVFQSKEIDGRVAWRWVRENSGVAVIDHGFRIKPYGFVDDDWLSLDLDGAHNERDWRTAIAKNRFAISPELKPRPADNPALNLPHNAQLVGAVFIESNRKPKRDENGDLIPAMDREGLLSNAGFTQLKEYVRAGIEFLAHCDKEELDRLEFAEAKAAAESARADIQKAIADIQTSDTLTAGDKARIVKQYSALADRLEEQEDYAARARQSLMIMSLLGVVAGFMTHESDAMLHEFEQASRQVASLARSHREFRETSEIMSDRLQRFRGFVDYSKLFIKKAASDDLKPFSAAGQVRYVVGRFTTFAEERDIDVRCEVDKDVMSPAIPVAAYSGVLLNLYTNALKAIISVRASIPSPQIVFRAWNEEHKHIIEVLDNGAGVPPELRKRIWEPLYTTTAYPDNPLGPGMGLGLTLVRQVVREFGGSGTLLSSPPAGFSSCFRVVFPIT
jgi:signal transduction histidine kinase